MDRISRLFVFGFMSFSAYFMLPFILEALGPGSLGLGSYIKIDPSCLISLDPIPDYMDPAHDVDPALDVDPITKATLKYTAM